MVLINKGKALYNRRAVKVFTVFDGYAVYLFGVIIYPGVFNLL